MDQRPQLTFVTTTGPVLDYIGCKAVRRHTTKANFKRRRWQMVQSYAKRRKHSVAAAGNQPLQSHGSGDAAVFDLGLPWFGRQKLTSEHLFLIEYFANISARPVLAPSGHFAEVERATEWELWRFVTEPAMLEATLCLAASVYALRQDQTSTVTLPMAHVCRLRAIRSVNQRLNSTTSTGLTDEVIAAILTLTACEMISGDVNAWRVHISGLVAIMSMRSREARHHVQPDLIFNAVKRTTVQGFLSQTRHESRLAKVFESTGVFQSMFSDGGAKAVNTVLIVASEMFKLQDTGNKTSGKPQLVNMIDRLVTVKQAISTGIQGEAFLTAITLAMIIYLDFILSSYHDSDPSHHDSDPSRADSASDLMAVMQQPDTQECSCRELTFWQLTMGALGAGDDATKSWYLAMLRRAAAVFPITTGEEAVVVLQQYFWFDNVFAVPCSTIFSEVFSIVGHEKGGVRRALSARA